MIRVPMNEKHNNRLGRLGENEHRQMIFDLTEWQRLYPTASFLLLNRPAGENVAYPVSSTEVIESELIWTVTSSDLVKVGLGQCELIVRTGDVVAKSIIFSTEVLTALDGSGTPPAPWDSWQTEFGEMRDETVQAANSVLNLGVESDTLPAGSQATVSKYTDPETGTYVLVFGIPKGDQGQTGETGATGATGPRGPEGPAGQNGEPGSDGASAYLWIRYSAEQPVQDSDMKTTPDAWIGIYSGEEATVPEHYTDYTWYKIKGDVGPVNDVQINRASILNNGIANIPIGGASLGVVRENVDYGIDITGQGQLLLITATDSELKSGFSNARRAIMTMNQHKAVFYGLAKVAGDTSQAESSNPVGVYTEDAKSAISQMLNSPVSVSGTTPTITALPGIRYVCGECATLDITLPEAGIVDVVFESGSTPTVLTITPPTGVTLKWVNGFDPSSLEADTTYEIRVRDGHLASAFAWT